MVIRENKTKEAPRASRKVANPVVHRADRVVHLQANSAQARQQAPARAGVHLLRTQSHEPGRQRLRPFAQSSASSLRAQPGGNRLLPIRSANLMGLASQTP